MNPMPPFFQSVPKLSWIQWIYRTMLGKTLQKSKYLINITNPLSIQTNLSIKIEKANPINATEYSKFLAIYFYSIKERHELLIPPSFLQKYLETDMLIGVEIRDQSLKLIGCIFNFFMGDFETRPMGLVTWMCVEPSWRSKGIGSLLLHALYNYTQPRQIHWWRNDGFLKSPAPPICIQSRIYRKTNSYRSNAHMKELKLKKTSIESWKPMLVSQWLKQNPAGLLLDSSSTKSLLEVYEITTSKYGRVCLVVMPTFEREKNTNNWWCEIITWAWEGRSPETNYEQSYILENMIDHLPYTFVESPSSIPHFENSWSSSATTYWSAIGLDTGVPVMRPVLPLLVC
jgi:GNAT superfamily N-acetyltransferase